MNQKVMIFSSVHQYDDSRIFHKQAASLAKAGYDVELHAVGDFEEKIEQGVLIQGVKRVNKKWKRLTLGWELYKRARKSNADIFHFHDPELLPWGALLRWRTGKPVIYDAHEDLPKQIYTKPWIPQKLRGPISSVVRLIEKSLAKKLDCVITATESIYDQFTCARKRVVIKNYPLPMRVGEVEQGSKNLILYIGGVSYLRGYSEMVKMMDYIPREINAELHIIGALQHIALEDQNTAVLEKKKIFLHGRIPFEEVKRWLSKGKVGLVCLHPIENYRESLPIKMFEYMAAGLPVVATNFPMWEEIIDGNECGFTVDALDPHEMAQKVAWLLSDGQLHKQMSHNGMHAFREKYNWHVEEQKLLEVYRAFV